ncbi:hypothetical protein HDU76_004821 [Blyttiomyces sp. JEL0837]|nr:hypothetical protein HDU76_004821 [Blyttiomyces sp. JEL0837]
MTATIATPPRAEKKEVKKFSLWDRLPHEIKEHIITLTNDPFSSLLNNQLSPGEMILNSNVIWKHVFQSNWEGDLRVLPLDRLPTIKSGLLLVQSRSMYQQLSTLRPDLISMNMFDSIKDDLFTTDNLFLNNPKYYEKIEKVMNGSLLQIAMRQCWMDEIRKFRETVLGHLDTLGQFKALCNLSIYFGHLNLLNYIQSSFKQKFKYELSDPATIGRYLGLAAAKQGDAELFDHALTIYPFHFGDWAIMWNMSWNRGNSLMCDRLIQVRRGNGQRHVVIKCLTSTGEILATSDIQLWKKCLATAVASNKPLVTVMLRISSWEHVNVFIEFLPRLSPRTIRASLNYVAQRGDADLFKYLYLRVYKDRREPGAGWIEAMCDGILKGLESMNAGADTYICAKAVDLWHRYGGASKHPCDQNWVAKIQVDRYKLHIVEAFEKFCNCERGKLSTTILL